MLRTVLPAWRPLDYLLQPVDLHAINEQVQTMPENVEVDEKKSKADKKKIKVLKKHLQKYMSEVNKLKSQLSSVESRRQQDLKNYQNEIQQLKDDFNISNTENIETVRNLNAKIQALKQDNTKLRRNTVNFIEPNSPKPSKSSPVSSSPVTPIKINHFNDSIQDSFRQYQAQISRRGCQSWGNQPFFNSLRRTSAPPYQISKTLKDNASTKHIGKPCNTLTIAIAVLERL